MMNKESDKLYQVSGIVKGFSWFDVFLFVLATPAASGIVYYSVSRGYSYNGASIPLAFLLGMIMFLPVCYLLSRTASLIPRTGGLYYYISRILGDSIAFLAVWPLWLGYGLCIGMFGHIVIGIMGDTLISVGSVYKATLVVAIGNILSSDLGKIIGATIWVLSLWAIFINGLKTVKVFIRVVSILPLLLTVFTVIYLFVLGPMGWQKSFNQFFGASSFENIVSLASTHGWIQNPFSFSMTLFALVVAVWAFTSIEAINFAGGEVRNPQKSFGRGFIFGWLGIGILYVLTAKAVEYSCGKFALSYIYLYENNRELLSNIIVPYELSLPTLIMTTFNSPLISILIVILFLMWFFNSMPGVFIASSRLTFAFSVDRYMPHGFTSISPKGVPQNAIHLTALVALFGILLMYVDPSGILGIFNFCFLFIYWIYGFATILAPYSNRTKHAFSSSRRILGVPIISLIGLIVFLEGWIFVFIAVSNFNYRTGIVSIVFFLIGALIIMIRDKHILKDSNI